MSELANPAKWAVRVFIEVRAQLNLVGKGVSIFEGRENSFKGLFGFVLLHILLSSLFEISF